MNREIKTVIIGFVLLLLLLQIAALEIYNIKQELKKLELDNCLQYCYINTIKNLANFSEQECVNACVRG